MTGSIQLKSLRFATALVLVSTIALASSADAQDAARGTQQQACSRDVSRHCRKQMSDGDLAIYQCLMQNREKLSPSCRKVVEGR